MRTSARRGVRMVRRGHHHRQPRRLPHVRRGGPQARAAPTSANEAMMRMFSMMEISERAGNDMDKIFGGWGVDQIRGALLRRGLRPGPHYAHASARFLPIRLATIGRNGDGSAKSAIIDHLSQFGPAKGAVTLRHSVGLRVHRPEEINRNSQHPFGTCIGRARAFHMPSR